MSEILKEENSEESKIPIIKVLRMYVDSKKLAAYYRDTPYILYKEYNSSIFPRFIDSCFEINEGLHCYSNSCKFASFGDGIHIFLPKEVTATYDDRKKVYPYKAVVVEGYIPPNTRFYINEIGEIVTQGLVLTNILKSNFK